MVVSPAIEIQLDKLRERLLSVFNESEAIGYLDKIHNSITPNLQKNKVECFIIHTAISFDISIERLCNSKSPNEKTIRKACCYLLHEQLCLPYRSIANYFQKNKTEVIQAYIDEAQSLLDVRSYEFITVYNRVLIEFNNHIIN